MRVLRCGLHVMRVVGGSQKATTALPRHRWLRDALFPLEGADLRRRMPRSDISWLCCSARCVLFTLLIAIARSLGSVCPQCYFGHAARDPSAQASCPVTLLPEFARAGASVSERMRW